MKEAQCRSSTTATTAVTTAPTPRPTWWRTSSARCAAKRCCQAPGAASDQGRIQGRYPTGQPSLDLPAEVVGQDLERAAAHLVQRQLGDRGRVGLRRLDAGSHV